MAEISEEWELLEAEPPADVDDCTFAFSHIDTTKLLSNPTMAEIGEGYFRSYIRWDLPGTRPITKQDLSGLGDALRDLVVRAAEETKLPGEEGEEDKKYNYKYKYKSVWEEYSTATELYGLDRVEETIRMLRGADPYVREKGIGLIAVQRRDPDELSAKEYMASLKAEERAQKKAQKRARKEGGIEHRHSRAEGNKGQKGSR